MAPALFRFTTAPPEHCRDTSSERPAMPERPLFRGRKFASVINLLNRSASHFVSGGQNLCLLDYVSNNVLRIYNHDLMFNDKKLVRLYLRHLGGHKLRESVQFDIGRCFLADLYFWIAWHLRNMRVALHDLLNDVALLSSKLDRAWWNYLFLFIVRS